MLLAFLAQMILPWWIIILVCALVSFLLKWKTKTAFLLGFVSMFLLWAIQAFIIDQKNDGILSSKIGELFGGMNGILLILVTAFIGGILGGMGAQIGAELVRSFPKKET